MQEAEQQLAESNATVVAKDDIIAEKEKVISDNTVNILDLTSSLEKLKAGGDSAVLAEKLKAVEEELKSKSESAEKLTAKNNVCSVR